MLTILFLFDTKLTSILMCCKILTLPANGIVNSGLVKASLTPLWWRLPLRDWRFVEFDRMDPAFLS
jgi:hypothetical protein